MKKTRFPFEAAVRTRLTAAWLSGCIIFLQCPVYAEDHLPENVRETSAYGTETFAEQIRTDGGKWSSGSEAICSEDRAGCVLLQMVMMGSFDAFDITDPLESRVYAAVYPRLAAAGRDDFRHFLNEFGEDEKTAAEAYYRVLKNCLLAYIITEGQPADQLDDVNRVLLLFLDPSSEEDAEEQMQVIRENMTDEVIEKLASGAGGNADFIRWLLTEGETG